MMTDRQLLDSIITEMYELFKALISGNYTGFCALFADILSKLGALRKDMTPDDDTGER